MSDISQRDPIVSPWYPVSALRRANVRVRILWCGRMIEAARVRIPRTGRFGWVMRSEDGDIVFLPPTEIVSYRHSETGDLITLPADSIAARWGDEPEAWQPLVPGLWPDPLPEPLRTPEPRSGRIDGPGHRPVEMSRETAEDRRRGQWWRDETRITYEPEGEVTLAMCEGRLMRAVSWCGAGAGLTLATRDTSQVLADLADAAGLAWGQAGSVEAIAARFEPTPADRDDFDVAMGWFVRLNPPELWHAKRSLWSFNARQKILLWRAKQVPETFAEIGARLRMSDTRAKQLYRDAIDKCHRAANGQRVRHHVTTIDQMAAVRARNRLARIDPEAVPSRLRDALTTTAADLVKRKERA